MMVAGLADIVVRHTVEKAAPVVFRKRILDLQSTMMQMEAFHVELPLKHYFAPGSYAREIFMPAGSTVVGKIHRHGHLNIISRGHGIVATEFGNVEYDAREQPYTFVSLPGTKRAVHCLSDTVWTTFHVTDKETPREVEDEIIAKSYNDLDRLTAGIEIAALKDNRK